jgi:FkbM family methyltransferase
MQVHNFWVRADKVKQDLVIVKDVAENDCYQVDRFPEPCRVVLDVGAHIGTFAKRIHERHPSARIIAAECCPENLPALHRNVGEFATIVQAAVTYEPDVALLSGVYPDCETTGGNAVVSRRDLEARVERGELFDSPRPSEKDKHWADFRQLRTITLEEIFERYELDWIDVLKLDCEGSEFSILGETPSLDRIGLIVGEYHGRERFERLVAERFAGWDLRILKDAEIGTFWLKRADHDGKPASRRR